MLYYHAHYQVDFLLLLMLFNPAAFFHIYAAVGEKRDIFALKRRAPHIGIAAARNRAVGHDNSVPRKSAGTFTHSPADLARRARITQYGGNLAVRNGFTVWYGGDYFINSLKKIHFKPHYIFVISASISERLSAGTAPRPIDLRRVNS